ncbi:hypothetical protein PAPHI01_1838 [Pancytospora philotis]|nr:hypothetical protein PAPHI01_1838 [Pancytospora philotis]
MQPLMILQHCCTLAVLRAVSSESQLPARVGAMQLAAAEPRVHPLRARPQSIARAIRFEMLRGRLRRCVAAHDALKLDFKARLNRLRSDFEWSVDSARNVIDVFYGCMHKLLDRLGGNIHKLKHCAELSPEQTSSRMGEYRHRLKICNEALRWLKSICVSQAAWLYANVRSYYEHDDQCGMNTGLFLVVDRSVGYRTYNMDELVRNSRPAQGDCSSQLDSFANALQSAPGAALGIRSSTVASVFQLISVYIMGVLRGSHGVSADAAVLVGRYHRNEDFRAWLDSWARREPDKAELHQHLILDPSEYEKINRKVDVQAGPVYTRAEIGLATKLLFSHAVYRFCGGKRPALQGMQAEVAHDAAEHKKVRWRSKVTQLVYNKRDATENFTTEALPVQLELKRTDGAEPHVTSVLDFATTYRTGMSDVCRFIELVYAAIFAGHELLDADNIEMTVDFISSLLDLRLELVLPRKRTLYLSHKRGAFAASRARCCGINNILDSKPSDAAYGTDHSLAARKCIIDLLAPIAYSKDGAEHGAVADPSSVYHFLFSMDQSKERSHQLALERASTARCQPSIVLWEHKSCWFCVPGAKQMPAIAAEK